jgi:cation:H+ antiporter
MIAHKTRLGGLWVGLLLLAAVTSLPELVTGIGAVAVVGSPDLAMGTAFGSNLFNLAIIAILDIAYRQGPLLTWVGAGHRLSAGVGIVLIGFAAGSILLGREWGGALGWVGIYSLVLVVLYLLGASMIFRFGLKQGGPQQARALRYENISARRAYVGFAVAALAIIGLGTWLAIIGDELAAGTGWGASFVGSLFLAATTSLPELVVAIVALRLGAIDMAIANMLGSNMFNMGIVIAGDDLFYRQASIFSASSTSHVYAAPMAILMTLIVIGGLTFRAKRKLPIGMSWYSVALIVAYLVGAYILFTTGVPAE